MAVERMAVRLPAAFAALEPFAAIWALPTMEARHRQRLATSQEERQAFYDAMAPCFDAVVDYLDRRPMAAMGREDLALLQLSLALVDVSLSVEVFGAAHEPEHALWARKVAVARDLDQL